MPLLQHLVLDCILHPELSSFLTLRAQVCGGAWRRKGLHFVKSGYARQLSTESSQKRPRPPSMLCGKLLATRVANVPPKNKRIPRSCFVPRSVEWPRHRRPSKKRLTTRRRRPHFPREGSNGCGTVRLLQPLVLIRTPSNNHEVLLCLIRRFLTTSGVGVEMPICRQAAILPLDVAGDVHEEGDGEQEGLHDVRHLSRQRIMGARSPGSSRSRALKKPPASTSHVKLSRRWLLKLGTADKHRDKKLSRVPWPTGGRRS